MIPFVVLFGILVAIAIWLLLLKKYKSPVLDQPWPFYAKKPLSEVEQVLYPPSGEGYVPECLVLAQVQLSRILGVKKGFNFSFSRREADAKKQKALESAGITLIRWRTVSLPDELKTHNPTSGIARTGVVCF
ncbi:MAG: hypothetical protein HYV00_06015 [Deltaproteobacteria bacterium]|nr:hypothetical protein [Deltaproteobacteria bacterium]